MGSTPKEALKQLALGVAFRWLGLCYFYSSPACQQAPGTNKQCCVMGGCQDVDVGCWDFCGDLYGRLWWLLQGIVPPEWVRTDNRDPRSTGCCLSRQRLQLSSQRIFLEKSRCVCLCRRVLVKVFALLFSSLPPHLLSLSFPLLLPPKSLAAEADSCRSLQENPAHSTSLG